MFVNLIIFSKRRSPPRPSQPPPLLRRRRRTNVPIDDETDEAVDAVAHVAIADHAV